jgi:hypothetical protein
MTATISCPACGRHFMEVMPEDYCLLFYECPACKAELRPKRGDCCVFCSYADKPCPSKCNQRGLKT